MDESIHRDLKTKMTVKTILVREPSIPFWKNFLKTLRISVGLLVFNTSRRP